MKTIQIFIHRYFHSSLLGLFEVRAAEYLDSQPEPEPSGVNKFLKGLGRKDLKCYMHSIYNDCRVTFSFSYWCHVLLTWCRQQNEISPEEVRTKQQEASWVFPWQQTSEFHRSSCEWRKVCVVLWKIACFGKMARFGVTKLDTWLLLSLGRKEKHKNRNRSGQNSSQGSYVREQEMEEGDDP